MEESKLLWESKYTKAVVPSIIAYLSAAFFFFILIIGIFIVIKRGLLLWPLWILLFLALIIYIFSIFQPLKFAFKVVILKIKSDCIEIWHRKKNYLIKKHNLTDIERIRIVYLIIRGEGGTIPDYIKFSIQKKSGEIFVYFINYAAMSLDFRLEGLINTLNEIGFYKFPEERNFWYRKLRSDEQPPPTLKDFSKTIVYLSKRNFKWKILNYIWKILKRYT